MTKLIVGAIILLPILACTLTYYVISSALEDINLHFDNEEDDEYQDTLGI